jgi:hypothetical protein
MRCAIRNFLIIFFLVLSVSANAIAQGSDIGFFAGGSFYLGDLNPQRPFYQSLPAAGLVWRKILNRRYAIRSGLNYGNIRAFDADFSNPLQQTRNLSFKSSIYELTSQIEFNFLPFEIGNPKFTFSPFIFTGLSIFHFRPYGLLDDQWIELRPLTTEGQGTVLNPDTDRYSLFQGAFSFGGGWKFALGERLGLAIEWGLRKTTTDYLDDVSTYYPDLNDLEDLGGSIAAQMSDRSLGASGLNNGRQRGNSKNKDWYSFAGLMLTYKIGPKVDKCPAYK